MWVWLDRVGPILFDATLSNAIFLGFVVFAMLICRQPTRRLLIARVALVASLAMIPLVAFSPLPRLDIVDTFLQSELIPTALMVDPAPTADLVPASKAPDDDAGLFLANDLHARLLGSGRWLPRSLTLIDLACVGTGLAWLFLGFWGVRWLIRNSREPSAATQMIHDRLLAEVGQARCRPTLRVTSRVQHPVVVGFFRPTILIPPVLDQPAADPELLRLSLLHEIAHAERWDSWFGTTASLAQTVWFFLPQMWWLRSQLLIDQEFLADRSAACRYGTSSRYAASLLSLAESRPGLTAIPRRGGLRTSLAAPGKYEPRSPLSQRMLMLLYCPFRVETRAPRSWSWTLRITLVLASIMAACLCIRWPNVGALEHRLKHGAPKAARQFRVTDFTSQPPVLTPDGRSLPHVMPLALTSRFDLRVEVFSNSADLGKVRIAGHALRGAGAPRTVSDPAGIATDDPEAWHQIRLQRDGNQLSLWIDQKTVHVSSQAQDTTDLLQFEPGPQGATRFRNLVVEW